MNVGALALTALLAACSSEPASKEATAPPATQPTAPPAAPTPNTATTTEPQPATPALAIEGEGLRLFNPVTGAARPLPFGTPRPQLMAALAFRGEPGTGTLEECGAGPLDRASWPDGLTLYFQAGKFAGWAADRRGNGDTNTPALTTPANIGPGSTRAELESAYTAKVFESTLGTEFAAGELFGLLDGKGAKARITNLWAGTSCNMR